MRAVSARDDLSVLRQLTAGGIVLIISAFLAILELRQTLDVLDGSSPLWIFIVIQCLTLSHFFVVSNLHYMSIGNPRRKILLYCASLSIIGLIFAVASSWLNLIGLRFGDWQGLAAGLGSGCIYSLIFAAVPIIFRR